MSMSVLVAQSCPTLCNPMDSYVHGILHRSGLPFPSPVNTSLSLIGFAIVKFIWCRKLRVMWDPNHRRLT